ncbi:MAG: hypothetical protein WCE21_01325, partial [Candidatus Babeliales bacterium]
MNKRISMLLALLATGNGVYASQVAPRLADVDKVKTVEVKTANGSKFVKTYVFRDYFVNDIAGMSEQQLRDTLGWDQGSLKTWSKWNATQQGKWVKAYQARAAIFQGSFSCETVGELEQKARRSVNPPKGRFTIRLFDKRFPEKFDIRCIAAAPENKSAVFQSASTFWALEGGMNNRDALITNMLHGPVQGEELAILSAGRSLLLKYWKPTIHLLPKDLLVLEHRGQGFSIDYNEVDKHSYDETTVLKY